MGLLAQLFRHRNSPPGEHAPAREPDAPAADAEVRGVGAVAVAAGVRTAHGMPAEFPVSLGDILGHTPGQFVRPGNHDARRTLHIPAADVAPGLARGKGQVSLASLAALAPDVFRWEQGNLESPQVRLPIQKLLQQVRAGDALATPAESDAIAAAPAEPAHADSFAHQKPAGQTAIAPVLAPAQEISATPVKLTPPAVPEALRPVSVTAVEQPEQARELRPPKDVTISTTLRAVVLGGATPAEPAGAAAPAGQFLAPRIVLTATAAPVPVVLGPSVLPSVTEGGISLAPRTTPDFAGLQNLFMTGETLDLAGVAAHAAALPGVRACVISGSAGSATGGEFSHGVSAEELRAASADLARIGGATMDTLHRGESDIALFLHGEACVAAVVAAGEFVPGVRERLARVAEFLAGTPAAR